MKTLAQKMIVLAIVTLLSIRLVSAQKVDTAALSASSKHLYDMYWHRHKAFNTAGWVLLAPGAVMATVGIINMSSDNIFSSGLGADEAVFLLGASMVVGSIPCFIISGSSAHKAYLELKSANVPGPGGFHYASLGVKIHL